MTVNRKRAGRLQKEGYLEYGADVSWTRDGSCNQRPLACQEVSSRNQANHKTMCFTLAHSMRIPRRTNVGCEYDKKKSGRRLPFNLLMVIKDGRITCDILASKQEKFRI